MFRLQRRYVEDIIAHAREEAPNECCGILAGKDGTVVKLWRTTNAEHSPYRYSVDPKELLQIYREIEANGWELTGIYHSHTHTEAYPSPTDVRLAAWPDAVYFLVSLKDPERPDFHGYHIRDGQVTEVPLEIVEE
ncbi:MAG TPA: M67 family metallopeptidase [Dehalococcoidia bacterium]